MPGPQCRRRGASHQRARIAEQGGMQARCRDALGVGLSRAVGRERRRCTATRLCTIFISKLKVFAFRPTFYLFEDESLWAREVFPTEDAS